MKQIKLLALAVVLISGNSNMNNKKNRSKKFNQNDSSEGEEGECGNPFCDYDGEIAAPLREDYDYRADIAIDKIRAVVVNIVEEMLYIGSKKFDNKKDIIEFIKNEAIIEFIKNEVNEYIDNDLYFRGHTREAKEILTYDYLDNVYEELVIKYKDIMEYNQYQGEN